MGIVIRQPIRFMKYPYRRRYPPGALLIEVFQRTDDKAPIDTYMLHSYLSKVVENGAPKDVGVFTGKIIIEIDYQDIVLFFQIANIEDTYSSNHKLRRKGKHLLFAKSWIGDWEHD